MTRTSFDADKETVIEAKKLLLKQKTKIILSLIVDLPGIYFFK